MAKASELLRVGILTDGMIGLAWHAGVLDRLVDMAGVRLCAVGVRAHPAKRGVSQLRRQPLVWTTFERVAARGSRALAPTDLSNWLDGVPIVRTNPTGEGTRTVISQVEVDQLVTHEPDVILDLGFGGIRGPILEACPLGVWSFHHGDQRQYRGGPPCFWELVDGTPITGVTLERLVEKAGVGIPLARAFFPTIPHSYRRNRDQAYLGSVELPAQVCQRILAGGEPPANLTPGDSQAPVRTPPSGRALARILPRLAASWVRRQVEGMTKADRWHVGVVDRPIETLLEEPSISDVKWLERPTGDDRYVADPFACPSSNGTVVLVEDYDHRERHGRIAAYRLNHDRSAGQPTEAASFPTHASYPYLVEVDGTWWCIPETSKANEVRAFKFDPDLLELEDLESLIPDVALADPTLFEWQGRWWLFGTDAARGANTHLRAWWAEHPTGPWTQHAIDPLCIDVRWARGAGTPFKHDGELHRPAQDCSLSYGGSVVIRRVLALDPTRFEEEVAATVRPDPDGEYPDGLHTISQMGGSFVVDGCRHRFSGALFVHELRARLRRLGA